MLVRFNVPRGIDKVDYQVGVHTLDDSLASHPYFQLLLKEKNIEVMDATSIPKDVVLPKPNMKVEGPSVSDVDPVADSTPKEDKTTKAKKEA